MPNRRKGIFIPLFLILMGSLALGKVASEPGFATIRAINVVRLIAVGMCYGSAIATFLLLRGNRPD